MFYFLWKLIWWSNFDKASSIVLCDIFPDFSVYTQRWELHWLALFTDSDWMDIAGSLVPLAGSSCFEIPNAVPLGMTSMPRVFTSRFWGSFFFFSLSHKGSDIQVEFWKFIKSISGRKEDDEGMLLQVKRARQKHTDVKDHGLETEFSVTGPD